MSKPQCAFLFVDEVPESATAGDLVLPLLHFDAAVYAAGKATFKSVVSARRHRVVRPRAQYLPRRRSVGLGLLA